MGHNQTAMAWCNYSMSCGELNNSLLVLADMVMCLTGACEQNEFPDWARPATCAAIAVTALVFFSLMYFGKSCSESRVKVSDRKPNSRSRDNKQPSADGPHWDRLKISMLANRPPTPEVSRHGAQTVALQTRGHDVTVHVGDIKL